MNVAFIPVKNENKTITLYSMETICGQPLVYWTIKAACECCHIDVVYVATDCAKVHGIAEQLKNRNMNLFSKMEIIDCLLKTTFDIVSAESAMLEFAKRNEFDNIVLILPTSPLLTSGDLTDGFEMFMQSNTDSVLSCVRQSRSLWEQNEQGNAIALIHNMHHNHRSRIQNSTSYLMENEAFYITSKKNLLTSQSRISGNIRVYEMAKDTAFEIESPKDWIIIEELLRKRELNHNQNTTSNKIKMFLTDCDGCLTDGGMYYSESGDELKKFNVKDGMGFSLLRKKGIITGIITGKDSCLVKRRAESLHINELHQGVENKLDIVRKIASKYQIKLNEIAYVGDDINDIEALENVGFPCAVNNALDAVKLRAKYVSKLNGGEGAIREIIEMILNIYQ